jgi:dihydrodipicolinate synthase/N-acetylneuraminate lyase
LRERVDDNLGQPRKFPDHSQRRKIMMRESQAFNGVFAVPPLARTADHRRAIDLEQNERIVRSIAGGGITRLIYGGNAFFYHVTLQEYEQILEWQTHLQREGLWFILSAGPSFGRLMDQAPLLRRFGVSCVMVLPCGDPRDPAGIGQGLREFADASGARILAYVKEETNLGAEKDRGLDILGELVNDGVCIGVKYAVVRPDPAVDPYLQALLQRVDRARVISGIGERPAVIHVRHWGLPGFTTGSGCLAPSRSAAILNACQRANDVEAEQLRAEFLAFEDLRDRWGPARVLHHALELTGIARTGAIPPFVSPLSIEQQQVIQPIAQQLVAREQN